MLLKIIGIILILFAVLEICMSVLSIAAKYSVSMYEYLWVNSHSSAFNQFIMYLSSKSDVDIYFYLGEGVCIFLLGLFCL